MKLIKFLIIFPLVIIGTSCVPEGEFLEKENELSLINETDDEKDIPGESTNDRSSGYTLSFEEMVENLEVRLNNNPLDSGRTASFTLQAPFSSGDKIIVFTQSKCSGKRKDFDFENFFPIDVNEIIFGEAEDIISDYVDQSSVFFKNIADPKPKVNLETSNFLPPYLIKLKGIKRRIL